MTTALSTLVVARSQVTIRAGIFAEWGASGVGAVGLEATSVLRAAGETVAALEASAEEARVQVTVGGYITGAEGLSRPEWLNLIGEDFFQLDRDAATRTIGKFRIAASATASAATIGTGKMIVRCGTVRFENVEPFTPTPGGAVLVPFRAQIAGVSGNIASNVTLSLVTSYPGLSVTNPVIAGTTSWITSRGVDAESQKAYGARLRGRWADLSPQTSRERFASLVRAAFTSAGLSNPLSRVYVDDTNPDGPGSVAVYLATDSAPASVEEVARVQAYVEPRWSVPGVGSFTAHAAYTHAIAVSGTVKGPANATAAQVQAEEALSALARSYDFQTTSIAYLEQRRAALMSGVSGAVNVVLSGQDETIPPGAIVSFTLSLSFVP